MAKLKNILSLFDGISCGRLALDRAGIRYGKYYASEIDKHAIAITRYNYPDTIFVGDVRYLDKNDFEDIDLIMGGSPCVDFSTFGRRRGMITIDRREITSVEQYLELKSEGYIFLGQSYLFWEFVRLLKEIKPKWFLLENVIMAKKWRDLITRTLEVEPIKINSAIFSAQDRKRWYWTNIPLGILPEDKELLLKDIILDFNEVDKKYLGKKEFTIIDPRKRNCGYEHGKAWKELRRLQNINYKAYTLTTDYRAKIYLEDRNIYRCLTPVEYERLQTIPDDYTKYGLFDNGTIKMISDYKRKTLVGNAWTVDVIVWIFSHLK